MRRRAAFVALVSVLALLVGSAAVFAQTAATTVDISDVQIARYPRVQAVVEFQNLTTPLNPADVVVTENGQPVQDLEVETIAESVVPVGIVLAIDASGSMVGAPIEAAKGAALSFIQQKRDQDFIALLTFADEVKVLSGFTTSKTALTGRVEAITAGGETAFYDGIVRGAGLYSGDAARLEPNMIVLTDGADTVSEATLQDAIGAVTEKNIRVFGVALESPEFDPTDLQAIVDASGGLFLSTPNPSQLTSLYGDIKRELDNKVVIRFTATQDKAGPLEIGVAYQGLSTATSIEVPGFIKPSATTTTTVTPTTFAEPEPFSPTVNTPLPVSTLGLIGPAAAGVALLLLLFLLGGTGEDEKSSALRKRLQAYGRRGTGEEEKAKGFFGRIFGSVSKGAEKAVSERGLLSGLNATLEQANIPLRGGEAIAAGFGLSFLIGFFAWVLTFSVVAGLAGFVVGILGVLAAIQFAGRHEKRMFEDQLPDTLTLLATSLRAGYSTLQAIEAVASEAQQPTSREFGRALAESRLGVGVVEALKGISERMRSEDFAWAVMAIEIEREVGGNLAEVLSTVADTMRQRNRLKREIKALTAEGRISAIVLGVLPFALFAFLYVSNQDYLSPLFTRVSGLIAIGVGLVLMGVGIFWLKKIVDIEV